MKKLSFLLLGLSMVNLVSCGGGGGISGSPNGPSGTITVDIAEASGSVEVGGTFQFHYSVSNTSNTAVTWRVNDIPEGNNTVGTISDGGLYTAPVVAPNPNQVTVKAISKADITRFDIATLTVNPLFAISPAAATVVVSQTQQFTANLPVATNGWWVNNIAGGNASAGTISSSGLYTAPAAVPNPSAVTITAVLAANNSKTATAAVTIIQGVAISPTSVTVPAGATQQFTANMAVNWDVIGAPNTDPSTWGTISSAGLYTAPPSPPWNGNVNINATSQSDSTKSANAVATVVFSNATMNGHYAFRYRGVDASDNPSDPGHLWVVGSLVADGNGAISSGRIDMTEINRASPSGFSGSFTGTYSIGADGRGSATLTLQTTGTPTVPLRWVMISNYSARMIGFDDTGSGWGNIDMQDPSAFSGGLAGTYVFSNDGVGITANGLSGHAAAGMFTAQGGAISSGLMDLNTDGVVRPQRTFTGTYSSIDPATGRGTWEIVDSQNGETWDFVFYALDSTAFVFYLPGANTGVVGTAIQQDTSAAYSNASLSGNLVFLSTGYANPGTGNIVATTSAGLVTADGKGNLTDGVVDINGNGNLPASGTYSISADGHGTLDLVAGGGNNHLGIYMLSANQFVFVSLLNSVTSSGQYMPQASGTYNTGTLRKSLAFYFRGTFVSPADDMAGQMTSDGAGNLTGKADVNAAGTLEPDTPFTGTYTVFANGRGQVAVGLGGSMQNFAIYLASGRSAFLVPIDSGAQAALGLAYRQF